MGVRILDEFIEGHTVRRKSDGKQATIVDIVRYPGVRKVTIATDDDDPPARPMTPEEARLIWAVED